MPTLNLATLLVLAAGLFCTVSLIAGLVLRAGRSVGSAAVLEQTRRLLAAGQRGRAVKLNSVVDTPVTTLILYALGLELSPKFDADSGGFRQAARPVPFLDQVKERLAAATASLERRQGVLLLTGAIGLLGWALCGASLLAGLQWTWPVIVGVDGVIGVGLSFGTRAHIVAGLRSVRDAMPALLSPAESLGDEDRKAAALAREAVARSKFRIEDPPGS